MQPTSDQLVCLIVDDNEINRLTLEHYIELSADLTLAGSLESALDALQFFRQGGRCDLILLDIEMPTLSGLELVKLLPHPAPAIVLVTSHRDFAVAAFDLHVADYLVKPVDFARFTQAITKVMASRPARPVAAPAAAAGPPNHDVFVKVGNRSVRINFDDVLYIEALSTYSVLVTAKQKHIVYLTLKALVERLPFDHFVRVHRSYIVNLRRIEAVENNLLKLGPYEVPVGKSYQESFSQQLRNL